MKSKKSHLYDGSPMIFLILLTLCHQFMAKCKQNSTRLADFNIHRMNGVFSLLGLEK